MMTIYWCMFHWKCLMFPWMSRLLQFGTRLLSGVKNQNYSKTKSQHVTSDWWLWRFSQISREKTTTNHISVLRIYKVIKGGVLGGLIYWKQLCTNWLDFFRSSWTGGWTADLRIQNIRDPFFVGTQKVIPGYWIQLLVYVGLSVDLSHYWGPDFFSKTQQISTRLGTKTCKSFRNHDIFLDYGKVCVNSMSNPEVQLSTSPRGLGRDIRSIPVS